MFNPWKMRVLSTNLYNEMSLHDVTSLADPVTNEGNKCDLKVTSNALKAAMTEIGELERSLKELTGPRAHDAQMRMKEKEQECKQLRDCLAQLQVTIEELQHEKDVLTLCKVCKDSPLKVVFLPCGHLATCESCAGQLATCCICRAQIVRTETAFLS